MAFLTSDHKLFRDTVREFCRRELYPLVEQAESQGRFPREKILPPMAKLGFFRIGVPEAQGGVGGDIKMHCILAEEVARVCGGFAVSIIPSVVGPSLLAKLGTAEQQAEFLEPMMAGQLLSAIALTEPDAGSDLVSLKTTARSEGPAYILNGAKTFITNGPCADQMLVAAVLSEFAGRHGIERASGINLFFVSKDAAGFRVARKLDKLGMRSSETGELVFEDCRIPIGNRLGGQKAHFLRLLSLLDHNRLYIASLSVGLAQAAFEASAAYAKQRVTFGKPIGTHQSIAFKIARMAADLEAARLLIYHAAELHDEGARATKEISMAKLIATEAAVRITGEAIQIHGGYGYMTELPVERYFRDAKVGTIWEGTSEIQMLVLARSLGLSP